MHFAAISMKRVWLPATSRDRRAPRTALVFGNEGLRSLEPARNLVLSEADGFASRNKKLAERDMIGTVDRFAHAALY